MTSRWLRLQELAIRTSLAGWAWLPVMLISIALDGVRKAFRHPGVLCGAGLLIPGVAAAQTAETIAAWDRYVAAAEARIERARLLDRGAAADAIQASGDSVRVPSGTISDWRGAVFIRGITLDGLLHGLQHPGTPPPQEDIVSSRVIARTDHSLRVWIRLVRHAIVTVSYDTEHEMRFRRWSPRLATSRSVATRIAEAGGSDHGFLWRLHSYWRYEQGDRRRRPGRPRVLDPQP